MRAVEFPKADIVKPKVVVVRQSVGAGRLLPNPVAESIFQLLLLFARGDRFRLIHGSISVGILVVRSWCSTVQRLFGQVRCAKPRGAMYGGITHDVFGAVVCLDQPG